MIGKWVDERNKSTNNKNDSGHHIDTYQLPPDITLFDLAVDPPRLWSEQREKHMVWNTVDC